MNNKGSVFLKIGLSLLLIVFLLYQTYSMVYKPITTSTAVYFDTYDGMDITGYFVRDEQIINRQVTGFERYVVEEGAKVSKGGTVAEIYANAQTAAAYVKADTLQKQIDALEAINSVSDPASVDLVTINNKISKAYVTFLSQTGRGRFQNADEHSRELLALLNRKQILTGEAGDFNNLLTSLKGELAQLKTGLPKPNEMVNAASSGFFVSNVDGLESILDIKKIDEFDETIFNSIASAQPQSGFGKIIAGYNWYIVAKMTNDQYLSFSQGDNLTLKTSIEGCEELSASVYKVNMTKDKNAAVVILSCNIMNGEIAMTRTAPMTIVTKSYSGIRISNRSVRVVDGQTGVYVVQGSVVRFRPIKIIHATDTYTLCEKGEDNTQGLRLYDEVIEKGKNLYDGKFID